MLTIDELYDIASETVEESLKFQGILHAIDMGMDEDDLERLFPWIGQLARTEEHVQDHSRNHIYRPNLTTRDNRDMSSSDERYLSSNISEGKDETSGVVSDGDASMTEDRHSAILDYSGDEDDRDSCGTCSCLN
jgi:hypothetical protein